ncbi:MOSC N-terminal beta barrel domain-containing protein [Actinomadura montaniterrae]|uniref:MOSC N-terminal beta barrel domain-containing protein n=1 Tax=Actinomadura montaniterrae TaxID=1803903 RepID=UPI001CEF583A|nr:MOSC domain-containing protein [Actinomadura montaniterrae]
MIAVIAALHMYPVKSAAGVPLAEAEMTPDGLRHDRAFMLVRPDGRHLSQREVPGLALVHPAYDGTKLTVTSPLADAPLVCAAADGPARDVTVHRRPCQGIDQGDDAAAWFSDALGIPCRLVRFTGTRPTRRGGGTLAYADGYRSRCCRGSRSTT